MGWAGSFYGTSIGKKAVVASTGVIMVLFLIMHMLGNLQVFEGPGESIEKTRLNQYAHLLRLEMPLLWTFRLVLLASLVLHVVTTIQLTLENNRARPVKYANHRKMETTLAARTMIWGGLALFFYVIYHILHFTTGNAHADLYVQHDVYGNVVRSFQNPAITGVYLLALVFLFLHLVHGVQSFFRTLGVNHPRYIGPVRRFGQALALLIVIGFATVPLAVLAGWVRPHAQ